MKEFDLTMDQANKIIMAARAHWFEDEDEPTEEMPKEPKSEAEE